MKYILAIFSLVAVLGLSACGDDNQRWDVACDKDDPKCKELPTEG
jgi:hypothetical protein